MNNSKRWILRKTDGTVVIAYGSDMEILKLATKLNAHASNAGHYNRARNTVNCDDLCDFNNPAQYMDWQSHNQPHKV